VAARQRAWCGPGTGCQGQLVVSARRLSELDKGERWRAWLHTVAVLAVAWVVLVGVYYLVPTGVVPASRSGADSFLRLGAGIALFAAILAGQARRIIRAELPQVRAVEALGVVIPGADARSAGPPKAEAEALASARGARSAPP